MPTTLIAVAAYAVARPRSRRIAERQQRRGQPALADQEARDQPERRPARGPAPRPRPSRARRPRWRRAPARPGRRWRARRRRRRPGPGSRRPRQHPAADHDHDGGDDHVDVEAPAPAGVLGEHAAEQQPDDRAAAGDRAEDAERLAALARLGERRGDQGQRGRRHERGARALERAAGDEDLERRRGAGQRGGQAEAGQPDGERPAPADPVGGLAAEQQQPGEGERVRRDDVGAVRVVEAQRPLGGRQRDVHDGRVERDHELGQRDHAERGPAVVRPRTVAVRWPALAPVVVAMACSFHKWRCSLRFTVLRDGLGCQWIWRNFLRFARMGA